MHHTSAEAPNTLERRRHVSNGEIRQRCRVPGSATARVYPDGRQGASCLTPGALVLGAIVQRLV